MTDDPWLRRGTLAMVAVVVLFPLALTGGWRGWLALPCLLAALVAFVSAVQSWRLRRWPRDDA